MAKKLPEFKGAAVPEFTTEKEAAEFFDSYSFAEAMEKGLFEPEDVELSPELAAKIKERSKAKKVTLRLRLSQIEDAKMIAREKDIPYQTLIRSWIVEAIRRERGESERV
jgi:predicted DNA binding CopG/RHH family protein